MKALADIARDLLALVDRRLWPMLGGLVVTSAVVSVLDAVGLGLVFLLLNAVLDPSWLERNATLSLARSFVGAQDATTFLVATCVVILVLFAVKSLLQVFNSWLRPAVEWHVREILSTELLGGYLRSPYSFLMRRSSAEVMANTVNHVGLVSVGIVALADIVSDLILFVVLNATLLYLQPAVTIAAAVLFGIVGVTYFIMIQPRLGRWGKLSTAAGTKLWNAVGDPLEGIKQVRTLGLETVFTGAFAQQMTIVANLAVRRLVAAQVLKPLLEMIVIVGLIGPLAYLLANGQSVVELVPLLALFVGAAYRLLPSFMRMSASVQNLHFARSAIDLVTADLRLFRSGALHLVDSERGAHPGLQREIRLDRVSYRYDGAQRSALETINLTIRRGESVGIVGSSGAGKTTLVDVIMGLLPATSGDILIDGTRLEPNATPARLFAYVPQENFLINDTVRMNIALGQQRFQVDEAKILTAVRAASLDDTLAQLSDGLDTLVGERGVRLSGGQRQRIAIARALYYDCDILVMDESTASLDAMTEAAVTDAIGALRHQRTLIIIAHRLSTVRDCDRLLLLDNGRIVDHGRFGELLARNPLFRAMVREMELEAPTAVSESRT